MTIHNAGAVHGLEAMLRGCVVDEWGRFLACSVKEAGIGQDAVGFYFFKRCVCVGPGGSGW